MLFIILQKKKHFFIRDSVITFSICSVNDKYLSKVTHIMYYILLRKIKASRWWDLGTIKMDRSEFTYAKEVSIAQLLNCHQFNSGDLLVFFILKVASSKNIMWFENWEPGDIAAWKFYKNVDPNHLWSAHEWRYTLQGK